MTAIALLQNASTMQLLVQILPIVAIIGVFYLLVIGPANKQRRKTEEMLAALKKGDRVLTSGGIYGSVQGIEGDVVHLRIAENVKVRVARSAVSSLVTGEAAAD